jgi:hypothetical protein
MTRMQARRDESIWSTDAAAGYCRPVIVRADTAPSGRARAGVVRSFFCVVLGTALGYLCGYLWRVL